MKHRIVNSLRNIEGFFVDRSSNVFFRTIAVLFALIDHRREAAAVVHGRMLSRRGDRRAGLTQLRRDVHRIEKGLIMRPRRIPFGKDYVPTLVRRLHTLSAHGSVPAEDLIWARDVLDEYFHITDECQVPWLVSARAQYRSVIPAPTSSVRLHIPAPRSEAAESSVSVDALESLARRRRSIRWYTDEAIDPKQVDRALLIGAEAPSACNRQNFRFHLVYGTENTEKVLNTVGGTRGFSHQVPAVAVVIGREAGYRYALDRHAVFVDAGLASMGFLYGLETQGLSSCCVNWPDVGSRYAALKKLVHLEPDEQVIMLIAIGHADTAGMVPRSMKRNIDALRSVSGEIK